MKKIGIFFLLFIGLGISLHASYIRDLPVSLIQPNGDTIHCFASGDEFYNYVHDINGYTIIKDHNTGYYVYALNQDDVLIPSSYIVGQVDPAIVGLNPHINISAEAVMAKREEVLSLFPIPKMTRALKNKGNMNNLVVFIRFSEDPDFKNSFADVESMFNGKDSTDNSMYNYFKNASYDQLFITSSFFPAPDGDLILSYRDVNRRQYYLPASEEVPEGYTTSLERTLREQALLERAINYIKDMVPASLNLDYNGDGMVDNVSFIVNGTTGAWSSLLWPHRSILANKEAYIHGKRVYDYTFQLAGSRAYFQNGTICHEMSHSLSAPDLYHYSGSSAPRSVGTWDVMDMTADPPQHMGAYMKYKYGGWIDEIPEITEAGTYTLYPIGSKTPYKVCYKIATQDPRQFYVLEYRNKTSNYFESSLPGSGLLIYRIDTHYDGNADNDGKTIFDEVFLFRPEGSDPILSLYRAHFSSDEGRITFNSETDPFPFLTDGTIGFIMIDSVSAAGDSIQFTYVTPNDIDLNVSQHLFPNSIDSSILINLSSNTDWTITNSSNWLSISDKRGNGDKEIRIKPIGYNTSAAPRFDTLVVSGLGASAKRIVISQDGLDFSISRTHIVFNGMMTDTLTITSNTEWRIITSSIPSWIESISPLSGIDTSVVTIVPKESPIYARYNMPISVGGLTKSILIENSLSSIEDNESSRNITLFPNPTKSSIQVICNDELSFADHFELYDISGKLLQQKTVNESSFSLDLTDYTSGIYFLKLIFTEGITQTLKVIKQ